MKHLNFNIKINKNLKPKMIIQARVNKTNRWYKHSSVPILRILNQNIQINFDKINKNNNKLTLMISMQIYKNKIKCIIIQDIIVLIKLIIINFNTNKMSNINSYHNFKYSNIIINKLMIIMINQSDISKTILSSIPANKYIIQQNFEQGIKIIIQYENINISAQLQNKSDSENILQLNKSETKLKRRLIKSYNLQQQIIKASVSKRESKPATAFLNDQNSKADFPDNNNKYLVQFVQLKIIHNVQINFLQDSKKLQKERVQEFKRCKFLIPKAKLNFARVCWNNWLFLKENQS
jgi:hypothetical protein